MKIIYIVVIFNEIRSALNENKTTKTTNQIVETSEPCTFDHDTSYEDCGDYTNYLEDRDLTPQDCMNYCNLFTTSGCQCWTFRPVNSGEKSDRKNYTLVIT